jgi:lipopolysaccharide transport system permease protein
LTDNELVIEAHRVEGQYWRDLWRYRELLYFLAWRDVLVRYKQTQLGVAWALLRPLVGLVVFTLVFGVVANLPSGGVPYPILVLTGLLPWLLFAGILVDVSNSLVANASLVSKVYFPRLLAPAGAATVSLVDFAVSGMMLGGLLVYYGHHLSVRVLALPLVVALTVATALGAGLWLAALHVRYRDVRHIVPFVIQFGLYVSPVGFSARAVPYPWRAVLALNPLLGAIEAFRWCFDAGGALQWSPIAMSAATALFLLASGVWYFRRTERTFADVI